MIILSKTAASNFVEGVDKAFIFIIGVSVFFLVSLTIAMIVFVVRYRRDKNPTATQIKGSVSLEILWTVIPTILVLVMFYYGWAGWKSSQGDAPEDALKITSIARMWSWTFEYENGKITDTLYVPLNKPVVLDLVAMDVLHSLYIPAFRLKQDMIPGQKKKMWFTAQAEGEYELFCAEYCGLRHSYMYSSVVVMPEEKFNEWYIDTTGTVAATEAKPGMAGFNILKRYGCNACHSSDGSKLVGPSYKGLLNKQETVITDGEERQIQVDRDYIVRSIYQPNADIVKGYNTGLMLSYEDQITEDEIDLIIEYFETLSD